MNTLRRRPPVIALAITAGALYGAVGMGAAAVAAADGSRPGPVADTDTDGPGAPGSSNDAGPRRHGRSHDTTASADAGGTAAGGVPQPGDLCPWRPRPIPWVAPVISGNSGGNSGLIAAAPVAPTLPVPVFNGGVHPPADLDMFDIPVIAAPAATAPVASPPPAARVLPAPVRRTVAAPVVRSVPSPAAAPVPPPRIGPPAAPPTPAQRSGAGAEPPAPVRVGFPDDLRDADLSSILATALPGLAAIAGMTALGGLVGYRQARAGYLLRAAGAGRFLQ